MVTKNIMVSTGCFSSSHIILIRNWSGFKKWYAYTQEVVFCWPPVLVFWAVWADLYT